MMKSDFAILEKYESAVFNNIDSFTDKFCMGLVFDLYQISFSTESVFFTYILDGDSVGQHVGDSIKLDVFLEWYMEITNDR